MVYPERDGNPTADNTLQFEWIETLEEHPVYDPDDRVLSAYHRAEGRLTEVDVTGALVSPRLGVRFVLAEDAELALWRPDGRRLLTFNALSAPAPAGPCDPRPPARRAGP